MASQSDMARVAEFLRARGFDLSTGISLNSSLDAVVVDVPIRLVGARVENKLTSRRQLVHLRRIARRDLGLEVLFLVVSNDRDDLESGLRLMLRRNYEGAVVDCFVSMPKTDIVQVWLDLSVPIQQLDGIQASIEEYLRAIGFQLDRVIVVGAESSAPSKVTILRIVKVLAPASVSEIVDHLEKLGFELPPGRWLRTKLDQLRKDGLLSWRRDARFIPTESGLDAVPLVRSRSGSDVERALVLGRRKWNY